MSSFWKRRSLKPVFSVGFSYGLLDTLNKHFQETLGISKARSSGLQAAYFGAYPLASIGHAAWILRHYGYRAVYIWGLFLYGLGALLAIPAIKEQSFGGFCVCIFIIENGLGSLETAVNPYIAICGPPKYSEIRINLSQAFNGIGTVVAPVLGSYVLFDFDDQNALENVQWVYTAIAIFVFSLAIVFFFSTIPEITDADMEYQAQETGTGDNDKPLRKQYRLFHAAFAQFCYCGSQTAIAGYFINYVTETRPNTNSSLGSNRFIGVFLMHIYKPRWVFGVFLTMCMVFLAPSITQRGNTGMSMLFVTLFFESICFPTIVALGMRGLGRHTKRGSGFIIGGVIGGASVPPLLGVAADARNTGFAMVVPLCVNFVPSYRNCADAYTAVDVGLRLQEPGADEEKGSQQTTERVVEVK
ncbi:hypothetical protein BDV12DRAFT_189079 [Aspergillus spectabilis]